MMFFKKKPEPLVTICLPAYNQGRYLQSCADSILTQTFKNFRLYIVNSQSPDETHQVATRLAKYDRVQYINLPYCEMDAKINHVFFDAGEGADYFTWLACDDLMHPDYLKKLVAIAERKHIDITYATFEELTEDKEAKHGYSHVDWKKYMKWHGYDALLWGNRCAMSYLISDRILQKVGQFSSNTFTDWDFVIRACEEGARFYYLQERLWFVRKHLASSSSILRPEDTGYLLVKGVHEDCLKRWKQKKMKMTPGMKALKKHYDKMYGLIQ